LAWQKFVIAAQVEAQLDSNEVELCGLAEPQKVRVISKGPGMKYFMLQPIQRLVHDIMRTHPVFQLIGTECNSYILDQQLLSKRVPGDDFLLSGDYAEATNRIRSCYSKLCGELVLKAIGVRESSPYYDMFIDCLCRSQIKTKRSPGLPQVEGQLMGSIVSFPILCLINAAVCRWSMELTSGRKISLVEAPLLINGDDCVFFGGRNLFSTWEKMANQVGLEKSLGKTYFAKSFCSINSRTYVLPGGNFARGFLPVQYVNYRLLAGNARSNGAVGFSKENLVDNVDPAHSFGARQSSLLQEAPLFLEERLTERFFSNFGHQLESRHNRHLPFFLPTWQGGLGLTKPHVLEEYDSPDGSTGLLVRPKLNWRDPDWVGRYVELVQEGAARQFPARPVVEQYGAVHGKAFELLKITPKWRWSTRPVEVHNPNLSLYLYAMLKTENKISHAAVDSVKNLQALQRATWFWNSARSLVSKIDQVVRRPSSQRRLGGWELDTSITLESDVPDVVSIWQTYGPSLTRDVTSMLLRSATS
jgi:hypothetical protein